MKKVLFFLCVVLLLAPIGLNGAEISVEHGTWVHEINENFYYFRAEGAKTEVEIVVQPGNCLSVIAKELRETGQWPEANWPKLYELNREVIGADPHLIYPGMIIHCNKRCSGASSITEAM